MQASEISPLPTLPAISQQRLDSLDVLRGFDMFCLIAIETLFGPLSKMLHALVGKDVTRNVAWYIEHVAWEGFSPWDLIMPLFMFMVGAAIPFAMEKYKRESGGVQKTVYLRIFRRIIVLWVLGMVCQGNLLALDLEKLRLFSNTLQAIAVGYFFAVIFYLNAKWLVQIGIAVLLLAAYWGAMMYIDWNGFGGGNFTPDKNLAEGIDQFVLGRWRDHVSWVDGSWQFAPTSKYSYTWILSSLTFVVTVMTGVFAGGILKSKLSAAKKFSALMLGGILMLAAGWAWGLQWELQMPIIKHIWTSSMVLFSSGICFILMGVFYLVIDVLQVKKPFLWLKIIGMNCIFAYVLHEIVDFSSIGKSLFFGLEQFPCCATYHTLLIAVTKLAIMFGALYLFYKQKIFLKV